jgi:hypothetical protein
VVGDNILLFEEKRPGRRIIQVSGIYYQVIVDEVADESVELDLSERKVYKIW